jgi:molecular chaperone DnaK (HSP70)
LNFDLSKLSALFTEKIIHRESNIEIAHVIKNEPLTLTIDGDFAESDWVKNYYLPTLVIRSIEDTISRVGVEKVLVSYNGFNKGQASLLSDETFSQIGNTVSDKNDKVFDIEGNSIKISPAETKFGKPLDEFDGLKIETQLFVNYPIGSGQENIFLPLILTAQTDWNSSKLVKRPYQFDPVFFALLLFLLPLLILLIIWIFRRRKNVARFTTDIVTLGKKSIKTQMKLYSQKNFTDDYETSNYKSGEVTGKTKGSYYAWEEKVSSVRDSYTIEIEGGFLAFGSDTVTITIEEIIAPNGFSVNLKSDYDDLKQFSVNQPLVLELKKNKPQIFHVEFHRNDFQTTLEEAQKVSFILRASSKKYDIFLRENYFFGPELGNAWVGFDPGTTGTCLTSGVTSSQIEFYKEGSSEIIPSVIAIKKDQSKTAPAEVTESKIPAKFSDYEYSVGSIAARYTNNSEYYTFQSIKKLLGYKNQFKINLSGSSFRMNGKQLTSLLIRKVFEQFKTTGSTSKNAAIETQRCVVAIPNNFTASKTQDLIDALRNINQFKELRYIYESEAVAFKYLSEYAKHNNGVATPTNENVLIYDMGGATINVSLLNIKYQNGNYIVDVLGKMGYGIGGDTIDYCLIKEITATINSLPNRNVNPFNSRESVAVWWYFVKLIKIALVASYEKVGDENYISYTDILQFIRVADPNNQYLPFVEEVASEISNRLFNKKSNGHFITFSKHLGNIIYKNIREIIKDILENPNNETVLKVDAVVFSGRSSHFPRVQEEVKSTVYTLTKSTTKTISFPLEEAKTAVAYGACWYGLSKGSILRSDLKTGSAFGIKYKRSGDEKDIAFDEIIARGKHYDKSTNSISNEESFDKSLTFDNNIASFYQVMGKNVDEIFKEKKNQHKYSLVGQLEAKMKLKSVGLEVFENDRIEYFIKLNDNSTRKAAGTLNDMEIKEQNAEHYTWMFDDENPKA